MRKAQMRILKTVIALTFSLFVCLAAYADGFSVEVEVTEALSVQEKTLLKEAGCPLTAATPGKNHVTVTLNKADDNEIHAAQQAAVALIKGARGMVFQCPKKLLIRYGFDRKPYPSSLAGTLAVMNSLLGEIEAGSAVKLTISGVALHKVIRQDGTSAYLAFDKGKKKVKLELGKAVWRVASLVADSKGKMRRVFRKTDTVTGTLMPAPVMISSVSMTPQKKDEAAKFWDAKKCHELHLTFSEEAWQTLRERSFRDQFEMEYVKADFECNGKPLKGVGVRLKGNSSLMHGARAGKYPLKIDFDRFKSQDFLGMKKLNLSNNFRDHTMMREYLAYEVFRKSGLCAGRSAFCKLYITVVVLAIRRSQYEITCSPTAILKKTDGFNNSVYVPTEYHLFVGWCSRCISLAQGF